MLLNQIVKNKKKYLLNSTVVLICIYALYLRLIKLAGHKLWSDELYQLEQMKGSFLELIKSLPAKEFCSYLSGDYYLIYPFFKIFSFNKWGLALPHIISTIIGFWLLYLICKIYFKTIWGYLITFVIVCFNSTLINHATEIRVYAVLPTLALACLYLSLKLVDQNINMNLKKKWAIGVLFVMTIWFHVYGIVIVFSTLAYSLLTKLRTKDCKITFKDTAKLILLVLFVAMPLWLFSIFGPHYEQYHEANPVLFQYISNPFVDFTGFLKAIFGNLIGYKKIYFLLISLIFPFVLSYRNRFRQISFLMIAIFFPIGLIFLADVIFEYWFLQRQFIWVIPFFAFFLGWSWDSFACHVSRKFKPGVK